MGTVYKYRIDIEMLVDDRASAVGFIEKLPTEWLERFSIRKTVVRTLSAKSDAEDDCEKSDR